MAGVMDYRLDFPVLKYADIFEKLRLLGVDIANIDVLKEPTRDSMRDIYNRLAQSFVGYDPRKPAEFSKLSTLQNPELHDESTSEIVLVKKITKLAVICGIQDFSIRDIYMPDKNRTKVILSGICNYGSFQQMLSGTFLDLMREQEKHAASQHDLDSEIERLEQELAAKRVEKDKARPTIKTLEEETNQLATSLKENHSKYDAIRNEVKQIKDTNHELSDKLARDKFTLTTVKQDCEKLRSQIVRSPERIRRNLSELAISTTSTKTEVEELKEKHKQLSAKRTAMLSIGKRVDKLRTMMLEGLDELTKIKEAQKDIKAYSTQVAVNEEQRLKAQAATSQAKVQTESINDKIYAAQRQLETKRRTAQSALDKIQAERQSLLATIASDRTKTEKLDHDIASLRENIRIKQEAHQADVEFIRAKYQDFENQLRSYHSTILSNLEKSTGLDRPNE